MEDRTIYFYNEVGDCEEAVEFTEKQWPFIKRILGDHVIEIAKLKESLVHPQWKITERIIA